MNIHLLRQETYGLLALAFRRPTPEQIDALTSEEAAGVLSEAIEQVTWPSLDAAARHLRGFLADAAARGHAALAESLSEEYCRLFLGPYELPCPPYGSVYLDGGQVMGPSAIDALSRYRQEGRRVAETWAEPPDHVSLELELMAHLSVRYAAAAERGRLEEAARLLDVQRSFLHDHLGSWGPTFAERLLGAASCSLYRFLGELLPCWLAFDQDVLEASASALNGVRSSCE